MAAKTEEVNKEPELRPRVEQERVVVIWKAPARPYKGKGKGFMTVPLVIGGLVALILLVAGEWVLISVVAALVFGYYAWTVVPPEEVEYKLTTRGARVGGDLYEWEWFTRWWETEKWGHKLITLEMPGNVVGRLILPVGSGDVSKVVGVMEKLLLNEKPPETMTDKAGKWLTEKFPLEQKI